MTIAALVTEGIGSYGDVAHVITDGLDVGAAPSTNVIATILTEGFGMSAPASAFVVTEGFGSSNTPTPTPTPTLGGGSGRRYPVGNLDLETWRRGKKRLKTRIEDVQEQIEKKRRVIAASQSEERIHRLTVQLVALQKKLLQLLAAMDDLRKAEDEDEAMAVYMTYRTLH